MRTILVFAVAMLFAPAVSQAQGAPAAPAAVQLPPGMAQYYIVFLKRGPAWTAQVTPETTKVSQGHMAHLDQLEKEGSLVLAGPFMEPIGNPVIAGLLILRVSSTADAKALVERDPGVKAGRFIYEIAPWLGPSNLRYDK